ncbi:MAG: sugar transferase [Elusimicrobiota bacterium]
MLKGYKKLLDAIHLVITGVLIVATFVALYGFMQGRPEPLRPLRDYMPTIGLLVCGVLLALSHRNFSTFGHFAAPKDVLKELGWGYILGLLVYVFAAYALKLPHLSRMYIFGGMAWSYAVVAAWHLGTFVLYRRMRARGWNARRVLIVGDGKTLPQVASTLRRQKSLGLEIAGVINLDRMEKGEPSDIGRMLDSTVVDYLMVAAYKRDPAWVDRAMSACQERGIEIWLKPDFIHQDILFSRFDHLHDIPLFIFSLCPRQGLAILVKQLLDVVVSALLLLLLALPMAALALLIRRTSAGPVLFRQERIGLNGRRFFMYKFRSMTDGTRGRPLQNELNGPVFKMADDPRVTSLGRFLRRYSIDELPQLWNVLVGDMSLVGPRPPLPSEVGEYEVWQRRRLSMRPGMTGLWQVSGRNAIADFNEWVALDLKYIDKWSLWLDLWILGRTIHAVLRGTGV